MWWVSVSCCNLCLVLLVNSNNTKNTSEGSALHGWILSWWWTFDFHTDAASGGSEDWALAYVPGIYAYCYEVRPATSGQGGFVVGTEYIIPTGREIHASLITMSKTIPWNVSRQVSFIPGPLEVTASLTMGKINYSCDALITWQSIFIRDSLFWLGKRCYSLFVKNKNSFFMDKQFVVVRIQH